MDPLAGEALKIDATEVHTLLVKLATGNNMGESNIQGHAKNHIRFIYIISLHDHL